MQNKQDIRYFCIITSDLLLDNRVSERAKLLYAILTNLSTEKAYCYATNEYLAKIFNCDVRTIQRCLKELEETNYIKIEIKKNNEGTYRKIFVLQATNLTHVERQKCHTGGDKNVIPKENLNKENLNKVIYKSSQSDNIDLEIKKESVAKKQQITNTIDLTEKLTNEDLRKLKSVKVETKRDLKEFLEIVKDIKNLSEFIDFAVDNFVMDNNINLIRTSKVFFKKLEELKSRYFEMQTRKYQSQQLELKTQEYLKKLREALEHEDIVNSEEINIIEIKQKLFANTS